MSEKLTKKKYQESQKVKDAYNEYEHFKNTQKPNDYSFSDSELLDKAQNDYLSQKDFSYDIQTDPLYLQYKNVYEKQGKKAREDSMGSAAALTGGYGSSYAQTVGNTAYNEQMEKLNDVIPELYSIAYSRYEDELGRIEDRLSYLSNKDKTEYSRYLDDYKGYTDMLDSLRDTYLQEYKNDISIQDIDWEAAYKLAMAEQDAKQKDAELSLKKDELEFDREKEENEETRFWTELNESNKELIKESDIYSIIGSGDYYNAIAALDYNYGNDAFVRYKALAMGIDKKIINSYFDSKYRG